MIRLLFYSIFCHVIRGFIDNLVWYLKPSCTFIHSFIHLFLKVLGLIVTLGVADMQHGIPGYG